MYVFSPGRVLAQHYAVGKSCELGEFFDGLKRSFSSRMRAIVLGAMPLLLGERLGNAGKASVCMPLAFIFLRKVQVCFLPFFQGGLGISIELPSDSYYLLRPETVHTHEQAT